MSTLKRLLLRTVNIPVSMHFLADYVPDNQAVQWEFPLCEQMPENVVKNLLDNARRIDVNSNEYENSRIIPCDIHRRDFQHL